MYEENFDLKSVVTPVKPNQLQLILDESGYDPVLTKFVVNSFQYGFSLGYECTKKVQITADNLCFKPGVGDEIELWNQVMKEVKLKHYAGPFKEIPDCFLHDYRFYPIPDRAGA